MSTRLYVGNLSFNTSTETVRAAFEEFGAVSDVHLVSDRETGRPRGFGFVTMGTPEEVRAQVSERIRIFGPGGGYIFNTIHNVQPQTPVENLLAMYETVRNCGRYPLA